MERFAIAERIDRVVERLGEPVTFGTVTVQYIAPDWESGTGVFQATCDACEAASVMKASEPQQLRYLAFVVSRYRCPQRGHANNLSTEDTIYGE